MQCSECPLELTQQLTPIETEFLLGKLKYHMLTLILHLRKTFPNETGKEQAKRYNSST